MYCLTLNRLLISTPNKQTVHNAPVCTEMVMIPTKTGHFITIAVTWLEYEFFFRSSLLAKSVNLTTVKDSFPSTLGYYLTPTVCFHSLTIARKAFCPPPCQIIHCAFYLVRTCSVKLLCDSWLWWWKQLLIIKKCLKCLLVWQLSPTCRNCCACVKFENDEEHYKLVE